MGIGNRRDCQIVALQAQDNVEKIQASVRGKLASGVLCSYTGAMYAYADCSFT